MQSAKTLINRIDMVLMIFAFSLAACQTAPGHRLVRQTDQQSEIQSTLQQSAPAPCPLPQTGQKRSYAPGDDGRLKAGKPWPLPRFVDNGDGTVSDGLTGLMWTKNADQTNGEIDWDEALARSTACDDGGHADWRLPNRNELASLIDLGQAQPALTQGHPFEKVQSDYYWTSTTPTNNEDHAWVIHFFRGFITQDDKGGTHHAWFVRNGE